MKSWDIVKVPAELWPTEDNAESFFAIVVSSEKLRTTAGALWLCPVRGGGASRREPWQVPLALAPIASSRSQTPTSEPNAIPLADPIVFTDLVITATQHEIERADYGAADRKTQKQIRKCLCAYLAR